jgi:hypothetical protein
MSFTNRRDEVEMKDLMACLLERGVCYEFNGSV